MRFYETPDSGSGLNGNMSDFVRNFPKKSLHTTIDVLFAVNKPLKKKLSSSRCRKRVSQLLHTHVALILICVLSALDATCVLGQIICDILIMSENIHNSEMLADSAVHSFIKLCPGLAAISNHTSHTTEASTLRGITLQLDEAFAGNIHEGKPSLEDIVKYLEANDCPGSGKKSLDDFHHRVRRAGSGDHGDVSHTITEEFTHAFHLGSMVILSILVLETFVKIAAMGKQFLHHKLEVFDAFVVTISWCLDVAFWEGIWAHPGTEAATILIIILPWRVIRIVNSFILVIQEKDLVQLKILKQQYRRLVKGTKHLKNKMEHYREESRKLQGLARKYGIDEREIINCAPAHKQRRRTSMIPAISSFTSLALIGALGSLPELAKEDSSSDEEADNTNMQELRREASELCRSISTDSGLSNGVSFSLATDPLDSPTGMSNPVFVTELETPPVYDNIRKENASTLTGTKTLLKTCQ